MLQNLSELTSERNTAVASVLSPFLTGRRVVCEDSGNAEVVRLHAAHLLGPAAALYTPGGSVKR